MVGKHPKDWKKGQSKDKKDRRRQCLLKDHQQQEKRTSTKVVQPKVILLWKVQKAALILVLWDLLWDGLKVRKYKRALQRIQRGKPHKSCQNNLLSFLPWGLPTDCEDSEQTAKERHWHCILEVSVTHQWIWTGFRPIPYKCLLVTEKNGFLTFIILVSLHSRYIKVKGRTLFVVYV